HDRRTSTLILRLLLATNPKSPPPHLPPHRGLPPRRRIHHLLLAAGTSSSSTRPDPGVALGRGLQRRNVRIGLADRYRILLRQRIQAMAVAGEGSRGAASCCLAASVTDPTFGLS
ncbi:unnamed protein product, partial [Urochloa humidicola]